MFSVVTSQIKSQPRHAWSDLTSCFCNLFELHRRVRMEVDGFNTHFQWKNNDIEFNSSMVGLGAGATVPELALIVTIWWLSGGPCFNVTLFTSVSKAIFSSLCFLKPSEYVKTYQSTFH
jgi:hypothetical protein